MKTIITILIVTFSLATLKAQDIEPAVPSDCVVDTLAVLRKYFTDHNSRIPQKKILVNGYPAFVKQEGIFIGGGAGINPAVQAIYNGVFKVNSFDNYLFYVSANYLYRSSMFGLNIGHGIVSATYLHHIN